MSRFEPGGEDDVTYITLLNEFEFFVRYFFLKQYNRKFIVASHHHQIIEALTDVVRGKIKRLIINIPPRFGKTELVVKLFVAWCLANSPTGKFIHLSYSDDLALDNSSAIRDVVRSDAFQYFFPMALRSDSDSKKRWFTEHGGGVYATAAGGAITGFGAGTMRREYAGTEMPADAFGGCILIDDPIKPDDAFSDTMRDRINRRFNNTIASRLNSQETPIIVIMQRLHENDMAGFLLAGGSGEEWEHLCIPAITSDGESIWPEKMLVETLRMMEQADPYTFAGQYMQTPSPLAGGLFRPDNIQIVEDIPRIPIEWVRGWDFASTTTGDFTAGGKLGKLPDGRLIIGDMVRIRVGPDERDTAILNACKRDGYKCKPCIPQDPGQAGVTQIKYLTRQLVGYSVKSSPESGNKVVRAEPVAAQVNVGNVLMLKADWNAALINEMRMFPNGTFDDQVDALSRAFGELIGRNPSTIFFPDAPGPFGGSYKAISAHIQEVMASTRLPAVDVCGRCTSFESGRCAELDVLVKANDPGCAQFMAKNN